MNTRLIAAAVGALTALSATPPAHAANSTVVINDLTDTNENFSSATSFLDSVATVNVGFEILDPGTTTISDLLFLRVHSAAIGSTVVDIDFASDVEGGP